MNSAPLFLALRYLRPKRSFVSVITIISVLGVALGVLMMIVVRSVMQGFEVDFRNMLVAAEPHVLFAREKQAASAGPADWRKLETIARAETGVLSAAAFAGGVIYAENQDRQTGIHVFGFQPQEAGPRIEKLRNHLLEGSLDLADGTLVVSDYTASDLDARLGDEVKVYPSDAVIDIVHKFRSSMNERDESRKKAILKTIQLQPLKLRIAGIVRGDTGGFYAYTSLKTARDVFRLGEDVSGVAVELAEPQQAKEFAARIQSTGALPAGWKTQLWTETGEARLAAMENEQVMMMLVLAIIALVAAFSVMNTTITVTTQKRREIGVLAAIGGDSGKIVGIFVIQAAIVGAVGTLLGLAGSFLVLWFRDDIRAALTTMGGGHVNAVDGVFLATIPAHVRAGDVVLTCGLSMAMCLVAALIPAFFASRLEPAAALRD